jgi:predicted LPLAT superfamily acyltransferase
MKASFGHRQAQAAPAASAWANHAERGSLLMLRLMSWISLRLGRRLSRSVLYCIAAYFFLFAPRARRHARDYLRRVLGRPATPLDRYRQIFAFASTIHDRVFLLNQRFELFDISTDGEALVSAARAQGGGALLIGAHLGSFEVARALGQRQAGLEVAMAMYADNARKINATLTAISPRLKTDIIELGHMSAMLEIRARLAAGSFVGMMGDRTLGAEPAERVMFLGAPASFPLGPMRAAAMLRRPVYFMAGLYLGGNRYHIVFEQIADFSTIGPTGHTHSVNAAVREYAAVIERHCRRFPYNWFNFLDFWQVQPAAVPPVNGNE